MFEDAPALLAVCDEHGLASVAFPAISCGVYGYPHGAAARIAAREVSAFLAHGASSLREVTLVAFDAAVAQLLAAAVKAQL